MCLPSKLDSVDLRQKVGRLVAYIMVESSVRTHHKFLQAGAEASWLWLCGLGYCQDGLTDGFIPDAALDYLGVRRARPLVSRLVAAGLWVIVDGGWRMHHYLDHNKSAEQVRATMRKRAAGGFKGGRPANRETLKDNHEGFRRERDEVSDDRNHSENPILPTYLPTVLPTDRTDGAAPPQSANVGGVWTPENPLDPAQGDSLIPPRWTQRPGGAMARAGTLIGDHRRCEPCAMEACARGVCVPSKLVAQWLTQLGHRQGAESEIRRFVRRVIQRLPPEGPVGDDDFKFWRSEWQAEHGTQARALAADTREGRTLAAAARTQDALKRGEL